MSRAEASAFVREAKADGWSVRYTGSGHLKFTHPRALCSVIGSSSPSCCRAIKNLRAQLRRALRGEHP